MCFHRCHYCQRVYLLIKYLNYLFDHGGYQKINEINQPSVFIKIKQIFMINEVATIFHMYSTFDVHSCHHWSSYYQHLSHVFSIVGDSQHMCNLLFLWRHMCFSLWHLEGNNFKIDKAIYLKIGLKNLWLTLALLLWRFTLLHMFFNNILAPFRNSPLMKIGPQN